MHYAANIFPPDDAPSRYLLLLACGDTKHDISTEATKTLYSVMHKNEGDKQDNNQILLPDFQKLVIYIYSKMQAKMSTSNSGKVNVGSKVLPYTVPTFTEVISAIKTKKMFNGKKQYFFFFLQIITYLRICLAKSANVTVPNELSQHPCENTPVIARYLEDLYKNQPETLNNYLEMILTLGHASAGNT